MELVEKARILIIKKYIYIDRDEATANIKYHLSIDSVKKERITLLLNVHSENEKKEGKRRTMTTTLYPFHKLSK